MIIRFNDMESKCIYDDSLKLTVKLTQVQYGQTSYDDVFSALERTGIIVWLMTWNFRGKNTPIVGKDKPGLK